MIAETMPARSEAASGADRGDLPAERRRQSPTMIFSVKIEPTFCVSKPGRIPGSGIETAGFQNSAPELCGMLLGRVPLKPRA